MKQSSPTSAQRKRLAHFSGVTWGALLLGVSSILSRLLGVARDSVLSSVFGVGTQGGKFALDAYYLAFKLPDFLYTLLIFGAMSAAFVPLYAGLRKKNGDADADHFANQVLVILGVGLIVFAAIFYILTPWILPYLGHGLSSSLQNTAVDLTRIMLLSPIFLGFSSILQGIENTHRRFLGMALAPLVYNASLIVSAWFFGTEYGVYALAWGVVVGAILHAAVQLPGVWRTSFHFEWPKNWELTHVREFFQLTLPRVLGTSATQIAGLMDVFLLTFLPLGSLSIYSYAFNLQSLPYGVVGVAVSTSIFAILAEQADSPQDFERTFKKAVSDILLWGLPAVVGLFLLREEIIVFLLQHGAFTLEATQKTAEILGVFVWAAIPQSLIPLLTRAFYARKDTWTPVKIALATMALQMACSALFVFVLGWSIAGIAWANLIAGTLNGLLLFIFLGKALKMSVTRCLFTKEIFAVFLALSVMTGVLFFLKSWPLLVVVGVGALSYLGCVFILRTLFKMRSKHPEQVVS